MLKPAYMISLIAVSLSPNTNVKAQYYSFGKVPVIPQALDGRGVNLFTGEFSPNAEAISIGNDQIGMRFARSWSGGGWIHNFFMHANEDCCSTNPLAYVVTDKTSSYFYYDSMGVPRLTTDGSQFDGTNYTNKHGDVYDFSSKIILASAVGVPVDARKYITKIIRANGEVINFTYEKTIDSTKSPPIELARLSSVTSSAGFQAKFTYLDSTYNNVLIDYARAWRWGAIMSVTILNRAVESCPVLGNQCVTTRQWPKWSRTLTWTGSLDDGVSPKYFQESDTINGRFSQRYNITWRSDPSVQATFITAVRNGVAGSHLVAPTYVVDRGGTPYETRPRVVSLNDDGAVWSYSRTSGSAPTSDIPSYNYQPIVPMEYFPIQTTVTLPNGGQETYFGDTTGKLYLYIDSLGRKRKYEYVTGNKNSVNPLKYTNPLGGSLVTMLDDRYNPVSRTILPNDDSSLASLTQSLNYPVACPSMRTCNKPTSIQDELGRVTDYVFSVDHGGVRSVTSPPDASGIRPQVRTDYGQFVASILASNGALVPAGAPIWLRTRESTCRKTAATDSGCAGGAADEVVTSYEYSAVPGYGNLWPRSITNDATGIASKTCFNYDVYGNTIREVNLQSGVSQCP